MNLLMKENKRVNIGFEKELRKGKMEGRNEREKKRN